MDGTATKLVYYQKTVGYNVGVRAHSLDNQGFLLTGLQPWIGVKEENLRDFKIANKRAISEGLILQVEEPAVDIQTPNALTDADIDTLLKNQAKLRAGVKNIDSLPIVLRIQEKAQDKGLSQSTLDIIEARIDELSDAEQDFSALERKLFGDEQEEEKEQKKKRSR